MKIMITGASGLLGRALLRSLVSYELIPCCSTKSTADKNWESFDVSDKTTTIETIIKHKPDIIIHGAAIGSVDKVQSDCKSGIDTNLYGTLNVLEGAEKVNTKIIFISTNAVFDGVNPPYTENSLLCPISNYGIIKAVSELAIQSSKLQWMIIRPILMYGNNHHAQRGNWVTIWLDKLKKSEKCLVVNDIITQPLYNYDCASVINSAISTGSWNNIFNVGGDDTVTLYEFAKCVATAYGYDIKLIEPVSSSYFKNIAPRPRDTSYDLTKIKSVLHHKPMSIYDGLSLMQQENKND